MAARETLLDHQFLVNFFSEFILKKKEGMLGKSFQFSQAINREYTLDIDRILHCMQLS